MNITNALVIEAINLSLSRNWRVLDGRPIYRLVWSEDQIERRKGTFTDWYGSILIREEHVAVRDIKKYWYFECPCWVLEKLIFMPKWDQMKDLIEELVHARNGTYEPIVTFKKNKQPTPVSHDVVDAVIHRLHNPLEPMSPKDFKILELAEEKEEVDFFESELRQDERSPLFVFENSAFVSTAQMEFRKKRDAMEYTEKTGPIDLQTSNIV